MSGGAYTDSFDSTTPLKSTNGLYDATKRGEEGGVATNSIGDTSNIGNCYIWGDALSNGGTIPNTGYVQGEIINNFRTELPRVDRPEFWSTNPTPSTLSGVQTLVAGTKDYPACFKVTDINLGSKDRLTISNPTPGQASYVEIWCTGEMKTNAQAVMTFEAGVVVKFFVEGNFSIAGGGVNNLSNRAANLFLYGITPPDGIAREFKLAGSADFTGVIYCPGFNFVSTGGGNYQGAIVAKTANVTGNAGFHYDESLGLVDSDTFGGYEMNSWIEDIR
jgi:hypothetical protein